MTIRPLRSPEVAHAPLRVVSGRRLPRPQIGLWLVYTLVAVVAFFAMTPVIAAVNVVLPWST